jgi:hypothetical protein
LEGRKVDERSLLEANEVDEEAACGWIGREVCGSCNSIERVLNDVGVQLDCGKFNGSKTHASYMRQEALGSGEATKSGEKLAF